MLFDSSKHAYARRVGVVTKQSCKEDTDTENGQIHV